MCSNLRRFHFDLDQIAKPPESGNNEFSKAWEKTMSYSEGFPHAIAVGLGLIFSFAVSLLVLVAFGGISLF